jgi:hypothetical protein
VNNVWQKIFMKYIKCYESILILEDYDIFDEEEVLKYKSNLLSEIILTFKSEVEE